MGMKGGCDIEKHHTGEVEKLRSEVARLRKIKERQQIKIKQLKKENQQYPNKYKQYPLYVIFDSKFEFVNQSFEDLLGYEKNEIFQSELEFRKLIAPEYRQTVENAFNGGMLGNYKSSNFKFKALKKDGKKIECDTTVIFVPYKWSTAIQGIIHNASVTTNGDRIIEKEKRNRMATGH
jgi:PAS domain S-box-containing protein